MLNAEIAVCLHGLSEQAFEFLAGVMCTVKKILAQNSWKNFHAVLLFQLHLWKYFLDKI